MDNHELVEVTIFKTKPGVNEAQFLEADAAFAEALKAMGGFIKRDLLKGEDDVWLDVIHWQTLENAQHSAQAIATHPKAQTFIDLLDKTYKSQMLYLRPLRAYD